MAVGNREYSDRLFNFLFESKENKEWTMNLYNALNGSRHTDPSDIEIITTKEVLYLGMHNDVSFLIANHMNLYEQQSTFNPNMPLRLMQYAGNIYDKYCKKHGLNKYGDTLLKLPVPKLVVFYNGTEARREERILRFSDSFPEDSDPDIAVKVRMLNVNYGKNTALLAACKPLQEYSWLVAEIRQHQENGDQKDNLGIAIDEAIFNMPDDYLIKPFLVAHKVEVKGMLLTEYGEVEQMQLFMKDGERKGREEGIKEGIKEGRKEGKEKGLEQFSKLVQILSKEGRFNDIVMASENSEYLNELLKKYNIEETEVES